MYLLTLLESLIGMFSEKYAVFIKKMIKRKRKRGWERRREMKRRKE